MKKKNLKLSKSGIIVLCIILFVIIFIGLIILITRSRSKSSSPAGITKEYFEKYKKEDKDIVNNITYEFSDELSNDQLKRYKEIIKKQYRTLGYNIIDEIKGENDCTITVEFTIKDLKSTYEKANTYIEAHRDKFTKDGEFSNKMAIDYKLEQMEKAVDIVEYKILIDFYKDDKNKWNMRDLSSTDLKKIAGVF